MKKLKPWLIILGVLALVIVVPLLSNNNTLFTKVSYDRFEELLDSEEFTMIYIGQSGCSACDSMRDILKEVRDTTANTGYTNVYLDASKLTSDQKAEIVKMDERLTEFGTPTFIFVKGGDIIDIQLGSNITRDEFFAKYNEAAAYEVPTYYKVLTLKEFTKEFNDKSKDVFVIGQSFCGACTAYKPTINQIAREYDIVINYIEYDILSNEEKADFKELSDRFDDFGTPLTLIVKEGKILDEISGAAAYNSVVQKLKDNKIIK